VERLSRREFGQSGQVRFGVWQWAGKRAHQRVVRIGCICRSTPLPDF